MTDTNSSAGLTVREAAEAAGVSEATIRRRIKDGAIQGAAPDAEGTLRVPSDAVTHVRVSRRTSLPRATRSTPRAAADSEVTDLRQQLAVEQARRKAADALAAERGETIDTFRRALDLLEAGRSGAAPTARAEAAHTEDSLFSLPSETSADASADTVAASGDAKNDKKSKKKNGKKKDKGKGKASVPQIDTNADGEAGASDSYAVTSMKDALDPAPEHATDGAKSDKKNTKKDSTPNKDSKDSKSGKSDKNSKSGKDGKDGKKSDTKKSATKK